MNLNSNYKLHNKDTKLIQLPYCGILQVLSSRNGHQTSGVVIFLVQGQNILLNPGSRNFDYEE